MKGIFIKITPHRLVREKLHFIANFIGCDAPELTQRHEVMKTEFSWLDSKT